MEDKSLMPSVNQRIRNLIDSTYNGSVRAFCIALGFSDSQKINRLFKIDSRNGKYPTPSIDVLMLISNRLGISLVWLQTGEGTMLKSEQPAPVRREDICIVPLIPLSAMGGTLNDFTLSIKPQDCESVVSPVRDADFAITVTGESMAPDYPNGARVLIKRVNERAFIEWGRVYVLDTCNGTVIKELRKGDDDASVWCYSLNPDPKYQPFAVRLADVFGIYRVLMCMSLK